MIFKPPLLFLLSAVLLAQSSTSQAALMNAAIGGPALLGGAESLWSSGVTGLSTSPANASQPSTVRTKSWIGLGFRAGLRNDDLSLDLYNKHVGHFLDDAEKKELMDGLGSSLGLDHEIQMQPLAFSWSLAKLKLPQQWNLQDPGIGFHTEFKLTGRLTSDTAPFEIALFGNDPEQSIQLKELSVKELALLRNVFSVGVRRQNLRFGLSLAWIKGAYARTSQFNMEIAPPLGEIAVDGLHVLRWGIGQGLSTGFALHWESRLLDRPVEASLIVQDFLSSMHWGRTKDEVAYIHLPSQPISSNFDMDVFDEEFVDSTYTEEAGNLRNKLAPHWQFGARCILSSHWQVALKTELRRSSPTQSPLRRLSAYGRWLPGRKQKLKLGWELAAGYGRGPALGMDLSWISGKATSARRFYTGLGLKSYSGLFNHSRGVFIGWNCGLLI